MKQEETSFVKKTRKKKKVCRADENALQTVEKKHDAWRLIICSASLSHG